MKYFKNILKYNHFLLLLIILLPVSYADAADKNLFSPGEIAWVKEHLTITLSVDDNNPPMNFRNQKAELTGISIDYLKLIGQKIGIDIKFDGSTWDEALKKALNHEADGIINAAVKEGRKPYLNFTSSYFNTSLALITRKEFKPIADLNRFCGNSITVIKGSIRKEIIEEHCPGIKIFQVDNILEGLKLVSEGKSDAMFDDLPVMQFIIEKYFFSNLKVSLLYYSSSGKSHIGLRNDSGELLSVFNKAISSITGEEHRAIKLKWLRLSENIKIQKELLLTSEEKEWLASHSVIRVATDTKWAPIEYADSKGGFHGISVEYLKQIEKMLNIRFVFMEIEDWSEILKQAKLKKIDMVSAMSKTSNRKKYLDFSQPYFSSPIVVFTDKSIAYVGNLNELKGKKVGVVNEYAIHEWLSNDYPEMRLVPVEDIQDGLLKLQKDEIHAFIGNLVSGSHYIAKSGYSNLKVSGETDYTNHLSFGVRNDWPVFLNILKKSLDAIPESEKNKIYQSWASIKFEHGFNYKLVFYVILVFTLILSVFIYWNRRLSFEIRNRRLAEEALQESEVRFHTLSDAAFEGIVITEKGKIIEVNNTMSTIFGYSTSELISLNAIDLVVPEMRENVQEKISSGYEKLYESKCLKKNGSTFPVECHTRVFTHKKRTVRVTAIRDLTKRKQFEEEITKLRGLLPICANCKKIRDEKGYWRQIELYIEGHSEAQFSHSICEECSEELYGEEDWYKNMKDNK